MDEGINSMVETIRQLEAENEKLKFRLSIVSGQFPPDLDEILLSAENKGWVFCRTGLWEQYGYKSRTTAELYEYIKGGNFR